jgi:hypothetical protein
MSARLGEVISGPLLRALSLGSLREDDESWLRFVQFLRRCFGMTASRLEWSIKASGSEVNTARFVWSGPAQEASSQFLPLFLDAALDVSFLEHGTRALGELFSCADRLLVGYAQSADRSSLKFYLSFTSSVPLVWPRIEHLVPAVSRGRPPGASTVILGVEVCHATSVTPRVYVLYNQAMLRWSPVADYLAPHLGDAGLAIARLHVSGGVAFKPQRASAICLGIAPFGMPTGQRESAISPAWVPVMAVARRLPALATRMRDITWVTMPADDVGLVTQPPRDLNIYVDLFTDSSNG